MVANATGDSITLMDPKTGEVQRADRHRRSLPAAVLARHEVVRHRREPPGPHRHLCLEAAGKGFDLKLVKRIPAGKTPSHIMIDAKSTTAYVTLQDSDQLIAIDLATQTPKWTVSVGKTPADVFLTPDQKTLLVA